MKMKLAVDVAMKMKLLNNQSTKVLTSIKCPSKQSGKNNLKKSKLLLMTDINIFAFPVTKVYHADILPRYW